MRLKIHSNRSAGSSGVAEQRLRHAAIKRGISNYLEHSFFDQRTIVYNILQRLNVTCPNFRTGGFRRREGWDWNILLQGYLVEQDKAGCFDSQGLQLKYVPDADFG
jgi:hypothetical protein